MMFCFCCQTHVLKKALPHYFAKTTLCPKCMRLRNVDFEMSQVPYHHGSLNLVYASLQNLTILNHINFHDLVKTEGTFLSLTNDPSLDALYLALWMDESLYLNAYLRLDLLEYCDQCQSVPIVLIKG